MRTEYRRHVNSCPYVVDANLVPYDALYGEHRDLDEQIHEDNQGNHTCISALAYLVATVSTFEVLAK